MYQLFLKTLALSKIIFAAFLCVSLCAATASESLLPIQSGLLTKEYVTDETRDIANTPLIEAAIKNDTNELIRLLKRGDDPNVPNQRGDRALMFSAWSGNVPALKALLEYGADLNVQSRFKDPALMWATMSKKMDAVRFLVKNGANIHVKSQFQITVLMEAAGAGHAEMVDFYVDRGIDIYAFEKLGNDAAAWAERAGHIEIANHLREIKEKDATKLAEQLAYLKTHTDKTIRAKVERGAFLTQAYASVMSAEDERADQRPLLIYFYANYCPTCRATDPHLNKFIKKHEDKIKLIKVNIEKHNIYNEEDSALIQKLKDENNLFGVPGFLLTKADKKVAKMGMQTLADYEAWVLPFVAMK